MDDLLSEFLTECGEGMALLDAELVRLERDSGDPERIATIFRVVHTIKGTCGFLGLSRLERISHAAEDVLGRFRAGQLRITPEVMVLIFTVIDRIRLILDSLTRRQQEPDGDDGELIARLAEVTGVIAAPREVDAAPPPCATTGDGTAASEVAAVIGGASKVEPVAAPTLRVRVDRLEELMDLVGELVLTRNQLLKAARRGTTGELDGVLQRLDRISSRLQENALRMRMQPIGSIWGKLPRLVRDLGHELGKRIELQMTGSDTELDRQILEAIKDPLAHMIRNSADHGLETPEERRARNKPECGLIRLEACHEGSHVRLRIADDGRGIDPDMIRAQALADGLASEDELAAMRPEQIHQFIFRPGFSTARAVSSISGRGVGMDVVRTNIERVAGSIDLASTPGRGTTFTIKIPLTLAIVPVLIVGAAGQRSGIPRLDIVELVRAGAGTRS